MQIPNTTGPHAKSISAQSKQKGKSNLHIRLKCRTTCGVGAKQTMSMIRDKICVTVQAEREELNRRWPTAAQQVAVHASQAPS